MKCLKDQTGGTYFVFHGSAEREYAFHLFKTCDVEFSIYTFILPITKVYANTGSKKLTLFSGDNAMELISTDVHKEFVSALFKTASRRMIVCDIMYG